MSDGIEHDPDGRDGAAAARSRLGVTSEDVRRVRVGHGANCSSMGSVVDTLFATATIGAAVFAAVVAALGREPVKVAKTAPRPAPPGPPDQRDRRP
jgi:hypothetical protein